MEFSLQQSLEKAWTVMSAAIWATIGGGVGVLTDALDDAAQYEGPLDWPHLRKLFLTGAIIGFVAWLKKEKALATPVPPTPASDAEAVKRTVEAAQTAPVVLVIEATKPAKEEKP